MVLSLPVLVKQNRIPESVHYFSEGRGFSQLRDRPSISFSCASYRYIYRHAALFVYFTTEKGSKKVLTDYDRIHWTYAHTLCSSGVGWGFLSVMYI